ncbi:BON domain-containing protein [Streptomyces shenzhenensis]|uniref:BON domain-containing protein n=1 Tax=Streptomyces shenzhenensis TaxID=943815 RepID=UPI003411251B
MQDTVLRFSVLEELSWDPRVDASAITVVAEAGTVTLRGTVSSLRQRHDAVRAARRVGGARQVTDTLTVWLPPAHRRDDADLHSDVLHALLLNASIPATVNAFARNGVVTLMGLVTWHHERLETEAAAANVLGVREVVDLIRLRPTRQADPVEIARAAERIGLPRDVSLNVTDGAVTVTGSVSGLGDHGRALALAWSAPGTVAVHDLLVVG